ncbi:MAG: Gfo/Idh/MocA family oxidoreductase [Bacillota bacterium]
MEKKIKTAIIGFGLSGKVFHAPILKSLEAYELCKIYTRNKESIAAAEALYPCTEIVQDLDSIFDDSIELVIIAAPNVMHFELASRALLCGKNVVLEKPFTVDIKEALQLIKLAKAQGRILTVYQNRRWDSDFRTVRKIIDSGMLGRLVEYEAHFDRFRSKPKENAWREEQSPGSGVLYDLGSHLIDQALCLFGMPKELYADIRTQREGARVDDNFEIIMYYDSLKVTLKAGMLVKAELPRFILLGDKGSFVKYGLDVQEKALLNGDIPYNNSKWGREPENLWGIIDTEIDGVNIRGRVESEAGDYREFYRNVHASICSGAPLEVKPQQAADTIRIIELAMESNKNRAAVGVRPELLTYS